MDFKEKIITALEESKILDKEKIEEILLRHKQEGGSLVETFIRSGYINETEFLSILSASLSIPSIELSKIEIAPEIIASIPAPYIWKYRVIPFGKIEKTLTVAVIDPFELFAFDDLERLTGFTLNPVLASRKEIEAALNKYYREPVADEMETLLNTIPEGGSIEVVGGAPEEKEAEVTVQAIQEGPVIKLTNFLLAQAVQMRASDVLIEPLEKKMRVRYRIDGVLEEIESPPFAMFPFIVSRIKVMSNLDIAEHRLPQDGRFRIKQRENDIDFRVSIVPSILGEKVALRILDKSAAALDIEKLGFLDESIAVIKKISSRPHGMIISCGPTGSGKTTTLYSILKHIYSPTKNIITVEDPVEYEMKGINQVNVDTEVGLTFASSLRAILRQDPDIIMVGEIRDFETVDIAIKAALTGHLVLSTLHTTTAVGSLIRLINMGIEPFLITSSLIGIIAQRLLRKLCEKCKEQYVVSTVILDTLKIREKNVQFYRAKGCRECNMTGYRGRIGVCETLAVSEQLREKILANASEGEIFALACSLGMKSFKEDARQKVISGSTSLEEALRTVGV